MNVKLLLKTLASKVGFHVVRNYQNPAHTLMGLPHDSFGTVLDVGANSGQFARAMYRRFPKATFHCFEPTPAAFLELAAWAGRQKRVNAVHIALGDKADTVEMNLHTQHTTSSSLLPTSEHCKELYPFTTAQTRVSVEMKRLDDYVLGLSSPLVPGVLLKIDVQGFELKVLYGAVQVLSQTNACIIEVSLDELYLGQARFEQIVAFMDANDFRYAGNFNQAFGADGHVISLDALFMRNQKQGALNRAAPVPSR